MGLVESKGLGGAQDGRAVVAAAHGLHHYGNIPDALAQQLQRLS